MRRSLALLSLATTTLVVVALLVPLGLLVRRQAHDGARLEAEREARTVAALVALALSLETPADSMAATVGPLAPGTTVTLSDGTAFGEALEGQGTLTDAAMSLANTITADVPSGWEIALPVISGDQTAVVGVFVPDARLEVGVRQAWLLLGLVGLLLIGLSALVADRLGRRLVAPVSQLADAAHRLGEGDLQTRVEVDDTTELGDVASAFNHLASRLGLLLTAEREEVADLSHRLRTPMTSLRLEAESLSDPEDRASVLAQVDRLEAAVDSLITAARTKGAEVGTSRLDLVVAERAAFWSVLAEEQGREMVVDSEPGIQVAVPPSQLADALDVLIDNVFSHTDPGVAFRVASGAIGGRPYLRVEDRGPGASGEMVGRGSSGDGSTGLGLDIARRTAELAGGGLELSERPGGGARVTLWFGSGS